MSTDMARSFLESVAGYTDEPQAETPSQDRPVKLGTIDAAYAGSGRPKVLFDGETVMGVRTYPWLTRKPVAGDRVVLVPQGHGYVIAGVIDDTTLATAASVSSLGTRVTTLEGQRFVLGEANRTAASTILTTSYADVGSLSVTATSHGKLIKATADVVLQNAGSGADRVVQLRVLCDGGSIGELTAIRIPLAGGGDARYFGRIWARHTPAAASHTWKLQALCGTASAVAVMEGMLTIEEDGL